MNRVSIVIAEAALLILMALTVYAVCARYIFRSPSMHAVEVSAYLMLIVTWCTVGWVHYADRHLRMDVIHIKMKENTRRVADMVSECAILIFCSVLVWSGARIALTAFERSYRSSSILNFPLWLAYSLIPIGGILLFLIAFLRLRTLYAARSDAYKS